MANVEDVLPALLLAYVRKPVHIQHTEGNTMFSFFKSKNSDNNTRNTSDNDGFFSSAKDVAHDVSETVSEKAQDVAESVPDTVDDAQDSLKDAMSQLRGGFVPDSDSDEQHDGVEEEVEDSDGEKDDISTDTTREGEDVPTEDDAYEDTIEHPENTDSTVFVRDDSTVDDAHHLPDEDTFIVIPDDDGESNNHDEADEVTEEDFSFLESEKEPSEYTDDSEHGIPDIEPSTENKVNVDDIPTSEDFSFMENDADFDPAEEQGNDGDEDIISDLFDSLEDNGNSDPQDEAEREALDRLEQQAIQQEEEEEELNRAQERFEAEEEAEYQAALLAENEAVLLSEDEAEERLFDNADNSDASYRMESTAEARDEIDFLDGKASDNGEDALSVSYNSPLVTPIIFSDYSGNDEFTARINETLDDREVFVFDFTENKSGYNVLPQSARPQFVDLPDDEVSPLDARTVFSAAFEHPGSAVVIVGPEVLAGKLESRFERGTQYYSVIVDTAVKLLREADENDVEVVTIGANSSYIIDDIISESTR